MLKTTERLNLILNLSKNGLDLELLKEFEPDAMLRTCADLEEHKINQSWYAGCREIQKELISNEKFFFYLPKMAAAVKPTVSLDYFLKLLRDNGGTATDYPVSRLISSMALTADSTDVFYDYLKVYSGFPVDKETKRNIVTNLNLYQKKLSKPIMDLPYEEQSLFFEPGLTNVNLVPDNVGRAFSLLSQPTGLLDLIRFLYESGIDVDLNIGHYESFNLAPAAILEKLKILLGKLGKENTERFMERWLENNCPYYDLDTLSKNADGLSGEQLDEILDSRSAYINLIYGSKICSIPLSEIPKYKEDILIYAITNKKNSFIRLVEENYKTFSLLGPKSILFVREFYASHVNINALNANNLLDCGRMDITNMDFTQLEEDRTYTFEEIKALYGLPEQYYKLYAGLQIPRVDRRLIVLKELIKQKLLAAITEEDQIGILAEKFSQKPLSAWRDQNFNHINGIKIQEIVGLLLHQTEIEKLIPQMKTRTDAMLALRNWDSVQYYNTIDEMKGDLIKIDGDWRNIVQSMDFSEQFLRHNQERIIEFLCQNGAHIAGTYYRNLNEESKKEALKRIVKAVLMGEFNKLKYYADDLRIELDHPINSGIKSRWMNNSELTRNSITVKECDDFYDTMLMGTQPQRTCLSYIDGAYKECLLSNFDSNKKVLYAYINGKIVGRAIVRLTKSRYSLDPKQNDNKQAFSFVDLEKTENAPVEKQNNGSSEHLTLFLERYYSSGISDETEQQVINMFIELLEIKAEQMGVMLVLSNSYSECVRPGYARTLLHIYISKSKAGSQYLDSLNGAATVSDEGGYKSNNFYIRQSDVS